MPDYSVSKISSWIKLIDVLLMCVSVWYVHVYMCVCAFQNVNEYKDTSAFIPIMHY